jgi:hypothetical protein
MNGAARFVVLTGALLALSGFGWSGSRGARATLVLEECDPTGLIACDQQAAVLSIPIADSGLELTYSSQWASARTGYSGWSAASLGLGGWSVDAVERYDKADGVLLDGSGTWRIAKEVDAGRGEHAVPTFDGSRA